MPHLTMDFISNLTKFYTRVAHVETDSCEHDNRRPKDVSYCVRSICQSIKVRFLYEQGPYKSLTLGAARFESIR